MQAPYRLAIKSLFARRSRTLLLIAVVAFSCALIVGITTALEGVTGAVEGHVRATVGSADVRIRSTGKERTFDGSVLERVKGLKGVKSAVGRHQAALSFSVDREVLRVRGQGEAYTKVPQRFAGNAQANGSTAGFAELKLLAGRAPTGLGEIVIDRLLADRMRWNESTSVEGQGEGEPDPVGLLALGGGRRSLLEGVPPIVPETVLNREEARKVNRLVGVRVGEEIEVVRQALPPMNISAILSNPKRALKLVGSLGSTFQLPGLKGLLQKPQTLRIVGIAAAPPLGGRPQCSMTLDTLNMIISGKQTDIPVLVDQIDIELEKGVEADAFVAANQAVLGEGFLLQTSGKITSGLDRNMEASRMGVLVATMMGFLASSFIIMTGMTTSITERRRELGMLRCIGASRWQLATSQLFSGGVVGVLGALVGLPLGILIGWGLVQLLRTQLDVPFRLPASTLFIAAFGALFSGLLGAAFPAWSAARVPPLQALASRAAPPRNRTIVLLGVGGLMLALVHLGNLTLIEDGQKTFWIFVTVGVPALFAGYFAMAVPATVLVAKACGGLVSKVMRLPPGLLTRAVMATPFRHGFTAASLMLGLSLMVVIWTQGGAIRRDWIEKIEFPDAFVTGLNLTEESREAVERLPFVASTCAIAIKPVEVDAFGVQSLQQFKTSFMGFEPAEFFRMTKLTWLEGDQETSLRRLEEGGAIIVAREFKVARGLGVGDTFVCRADGVEHRFEIVGVVTSPGLEMVSKFFNVGEDFADQALHAVFGSRKDLRERLKSNSIHLLQISFKPGTDDRQAVAQLYSKLRGAGILEAGSGRQIKSVIVSYTNGALTALTAIGFAAMLVASLGVANLIIAGIQARSFELGVLRAVGGGRGLIARLILSEAILIAITASIVGCTMGLQASLGERRLDEALLGIEVGFDPPWGKMLVGCGIVLVLSLLAAAPAVVGLMRRQVRELLASMKG